MNVGSVVAVGVRKFETDLYVQQYHQESLSTCRMCVAEHALDIWPGSFIEWDTEHATITYRGKQTTFTVENGVLYRVVPPKDMSDMLKFGNKTYHIVGSLNRVMLILDDAFEQDRVSRAVHLLMLVGVLK